MRGYDAKKGVDVLSGGGREVRIRRRWDVILAIWDQFRRKWTPTATVSNRTEFKKIYVK